MNKPTPILQWIGCLTFRGPMNTQERSSTLADMMRNTSFEAGNNLFRQSTSFLSPRNEVAMMTHLVRRPLRKGWCNVVASWAALCHQVDGRGHHIADHFFLNMMTLYHKSDTVPQIYSMYHKSMIKKKYLNTSQWILIGITNLMTLVILIQNK